MQPEYKEVVATIDLNDKKILGLMDTGSNITLMHHEEVGDSADPDNTRKFSVDLKRTKQRRVTFMTGVDTSRDAMAVGMKIGSNPLVKKTVVTITDLHKTIPNFPEEIDMIIGTNALLNRIVKFEVGKSPALLSREQMKKLQPRMVEVDIVDTMCDFPGDALGPLFMVRIHNAGPDAVFLADTGNKFSSFCLANETKEQPSNVQPPSFCGVGLDSTKCFRCGETNIQIRARSKNKKQYVPMPVQVDLKTIPAPASLTSIEKWCRDERGAIIDIQGNLGIDFWAGYMHATVFDFEKRKLFCVPPTQ